MFAAVNGRRYVIACACLLLVAGGLRFYNMSVNSLWYDEAVTSLHSQGSLWDVVENTRHGISNVTRYGTNAPILYPIALWAVQQVAASDFSVRLVSAVASVGTVGALLFWMPRLGVARRAAFLAALLIALSIPAIEEAQDASVHSLGALGATLIIGGTLQYLRDGRKGLLCGALLAGPLLHYGLVPFGAAAVGAIALASVLPSRSGQRVGAPQTRAAAVWRWLKPRFVLLLPLGAYAAGCAACWQFITRYQWQGGGWASVGYLAGNYYEGGLDAVAVAEFALNRIWSLLSYHMPTALAAGALLAFGAWLLSLWRGRRWDAVALLALAGVGVSVCGAVMNLYPLGGTRHNLYMGPLIFLAASSAVHWVAVDVAALARRAWVGPGLALAAAVGIAVVCAVAIRQGDLYDTDTSVERILAILDERVVEGDAVYVSRWITPPVAFYRNPKPANYYYEQVVCPDTYAHPKYCVPEMLDEMFRAFNGASRIWLILNAHVSVPGELAAYSQDVDVEEIAVDGWNTLHLITGFEGLAAGIRAEYLAMYDAVESDAPDAASMYNLYLRDGALIYVKPSCAAADIEARFFLHLYTADLDSLPAYRRDYGFDNLDFDFLDYGLRVDDKCVIRRALPNYPIGRIHAGQFIHSDGAVVWESEFPFER